MTRQNLCKVYFAIGCALLFSTATTAAPSVIGKAYDKKSGEFLYNEYHFCSEDALQCSVEYRDDSGSLIVGKELDYRSNPTGPALRVKDYRSGTTLDIDRSERSDLVVDAGFDNFVRSQWSNLATGDSVKFPFLGAGFDKPFKMVATKDDSVPCATEELCLQISLDSWFLNLLADPIKLSYSRGERKLLRYRGISNIRDENGKSLSVDIHYQYDQEILLSGPIIPTTTSQFSF